MMSKPATTQTHHQPSWNDAPPGAIVPVQPVEVVPAPNQVDPVCLDYARRIEKSDPGITPDRVQRLVQLVKEGDRTTLEAIYKTVIININVNYHHEEHHHHHHHYPAVQSPVFPPPQIRIINSHQIALASGKEPQRSPISINVGDDWYVRGCLFLFIAVLIVAGLGVI